MTMVPTCAVSPPPYQKHRGLSEQAQCLNEFVVILPEESIAKIYNCIDLEQRQSLELCVSVNCTIMESLCKLIYRNLYYIPNITAIKNITETMCNSLPRDKTNTILVTAMVGVSLSLIAVILRLLSRIKSRQLGTDDWMIVIAMVSFLNSRLSIF